MKVLLTNHSLERVGGTEKWLWTMAQECQRRGWQVEAFTYLAGETSRRLEASGVPVHLEEAPTDAFDLILVNHNTCLYAVRQTPGFKVFTSHGPQHPLEIPNKGADAYVAVSPEVREAWKTLGFELTVITNGVDLEEFKPNGADPRAFLAPKLLAMCKSHVARALVASAAAAQGWVFDYVQYVNRPVWDTAALMREADVVVGCGRTAYEALACGCAVLVFDARNRRRGPTADGWLTEQNIDACYQRNCSTRSHDWQWGQEEVEQALHGYTRNAWGRNWAERNCDVRNKVDQYLQLAGLSGGSK